LSRAAIWGPAVAGVALFTFLAWYLIPATAEYFGAEIYDLYFLALLEGRLDLPARVLRYEGHYSPDGQGFLYHGIAPLLTRIPTHWMVDLRHTSLAGPSIWFWAVTGTALWHAAMSLVLASSFTGQATVHSALQGTVGVAIWFGSPGLLIVSNHSLYHEPIAVAYAMSAGVAFLLTRVVFFAMSPGRALIIMAILAGVTVHARPNVAVGLYLVVVGLAAHCLLREPRRSLPAVSLAMLLLAGFGALLLALNVARFDGALTTHGSFEPASVQYGTIFWGLENPDWPRAAAWAEHGFFNFRRILPNLFIYSFDFPGSDLVPRLFRAWTADLGFIAVDGPRRGMIFLWPIWIMLAVLGLAALGLKSPQSRRPLALIGAAGFLVAFLLTLSYAQVSFRFKADLWGFVGLLSVFGLARFGQWRGLSSPNKQKVIWGSMLTVVLIGVAITSITPYHYSQHFLISQSFYAPWSKEMCAEMAAAKGFDPVRVEELCRL
jgi:hypothetical protein